MALNHSKERQAGSLYYIALFTSSQTTFPSNRIFSTYALANSHRLKSRSTAIKLVFFPTSILPISIALPTAFAPYNLIIRQILCPPTSRAVLPVSGPSLSTIADRAGKMPGVGGKTSIYSHSSNVPFSIMFLELAPTKIGYSVPSMSFHF